MTPAIVLPLGALINDTLGLLLSVLETASADGSPASSDFDAPQYRHRDVLMASSVRSEVLQNWINRKAIDLDVQYPGTGRRRLYTARDVVKIAVMRCMYDLHVDLAIARKAAELASANMSVARTEYLLVRPGTLALGGIAHVMAAVFDVSICASAMVRAPACGRVATTHVALQFPNGESFETIVDERVAARLQRFVEPEL